MGVVIRQSFWGSAIMYAGIVVGYLNTLLFMPTYLDIDQIGLIRLIQSNSAMLIPFAALGMGGALVKFYPHLKANRDQKNQFITLQLIMVGVANLLVGCIIMGFHDFFAGLFEEKSSEYIQYIHISLLILISQSYFEYLFSLSRSELNIIFPSILKEVFLRIGSLAFIILFGLKIISFESVIYFLTATYFLNTLIFIVFIYLKYHFRPSLNLANIDSLFLKESFSFAAYSFGLSIGISIMANINFVLISSYLGLEATGIFTISAFIGIIIEMPKRAASQVIGPLISDNFQKNDIRNIENIYQRASINLGIISILIAIGIITNLQDLFNLIPKGDQLQEGYFVVVIIGLSKVINMFFGPNNDILMYSNHKQYMLYFLLLSTMLLILLSISLIPVFGLNGAALASLITVVIDQCLKYLIIKRKLALKIFDTNHLKLLLVSIIVGLIFYYLPLEINPILAIGIRSTLITIVFIGTIYFINISKELKSFAKNALKKVNIK